MIGQRGAGIERVFRYACAESSVGRILVVMTDYGVVDVIRGDSLRELLAAAVARHPAAGMIPDRGVHALWVAAVVKRLGFPGSDYSVPLDLGTSYDHRAAG